MSPEIEDNHVKMTKKKKMTRPVVKFFFFLWFLNIKLSLIFTLQKFEKYFTIRKIEKQIFRNYFL